MSDADSSEKSHEPTPRKLQDARKKGEVAKSVDLSTAAAYAGLLAALFLSGPLIVVALAEPMVVLIESADLFNSDRFRAQLSGLAPALVWPLLILFGIPATAALLSIIAQQAFVVAPDKLKPRLSRISVISNAKNKFGRSGLFEFAKSTAKLVIYAACLALFIRSRLPEMLGSVALDPREVPILLGRLALEFLLLATVLTAAVGTLDFLWQRAEHMRKNRMSHKEMRDEMKDSEGDPHFKQARRQRAQEIAMNQMMAAVPEATVVVVNPTHFAVALRWDRGMPTAPVVVAKGVDEVAARIRDRAAEHGVPIHSDPPTARALHATVDIGEEIPAEHYRPIAAAIRFADAMRVKHRKGWRT